MALNRVVGSCIKVEVANSTGQHRKKKGVFLYMYFAVPLKMNWAA